MKSLRSSGKFAPGSPVSIKTLAVQCDAQFPVSLIDFMRTPCFRHYYVRSVPDIDQRWSLVPNNGDYFCAPAASLNWFYYFAHHGYPASVFVAPADQFNSASITANLMLLSTFMHTDPSTGTAFDGQHDGLENWINSLQIPADV